MSHLDDKDLLKLFADDSSKEYAFRTIVEKYQRKIYWHVRRLLIDHEDTNDVVQECFIKAWKNLDHFKQESTLYTWLFRIATNEAINFLRKKNRRFFISLQHEEYDLENKLEADSFFSGNMAQKKLMKAILQLPEKQRIVFSLKYFEEMSYEQIEKITGTSVGALKASFHHAVKKIEEYLKNH